MQTRPALLIDLDGTLYTNDGAVPGAVKAVAELRRSGRPLRFVTNTTRRSRRALVERLRGYGFAVEPEEVFTSVLAGARLLRERGIRHVAPFVAESALEDLAELDLMGGTTHSGIPGSRPGSSVPAAVIVGDLGSAWTPALLNEAFRYVLDGALLVALQKDRYWLGATGLELDAGSYVAALEYATGREALVCGKPNPAFYHGALATLGGDAPASAVMVGDDLWADVAGAQQAGLQGWLVRTGKFRADVLEQSGVTPDRVVDSIGDVPHQA
jgi:phospholysine phosphohistidine inorganic pyrophosphate phosphatase